jgi:UDPglucose--hexose-1-phosphate uridylyltransferase
MVPPRVGEVMARLADHRRATGACLVCDLVAREEAAGSRLVAATAGAVVLAPWASRFSYEMVVVPRRHAACLAEATDADLTAVATVLARALAALAGVVPSPALNLVVQAAPVARGTAAAPTAFHWHLEVLPRLAGLAGFETGTGFAINTVAPETAARRLRGEES